MRAGNGDGASLLDLEVVAEGVETEDQMRVAEQVGCGSLQGFLIARPMSANAFETWLRTSGNALVPG